MLTDPGRDADFAVLASEDNLGRLQLAMDELKAEVIAVPPFDRLYLEKGHAVHFRCRHPEARGFRVDVMVKLRGVDPFPGLWARRTTWDLGDGIQVDSLALQDLVASKKTQRTKDWPMVRRLVEASYVQGFQNQTPKQIEFWLRELRTPQLLMECVERFQVEARSMSELRTAVHYALAGDFAGVEEALAMEEAAEREIDRLYWAPLKVELEKLRHARGNR